MGLNGACWSTTAELKLARGCGGSRGGKGERFIALDHWCWDRQTTLT